MRLFRLIFGASSSIKVGEKSILKFQRNPDFPVKIGDYVNLWNKPNSYQINVYAKGSVGGDGRIGSSNNPDIAKHLSKHGLYKAIIYSVSSSSINLEINLKNEFVTPEDSERIQLNRKKEQLEKKYNPKQGWILKFVIEEKFNKKLKYILQYNELKMAINNIQNLESNLWLENENGEIVSDNNASGTADTIKTLRAIYSGYKIDLIFESKSGVYHFFKVNIKTEK